MLEALVFGHFLDFCIVSPKSSVLTPQSAMCSSLFYAPKYDIWSSCFVFDVHARWDHKVEREQYLNVFSDCFWFIFPNFLFLELEKQFFLEKLIFCWNIKIFADVPADYFPNSVALFTNKENDM